jgi:phosphatidylserine/phosphatidylglycerophosphate/cardiolipin synthase-like enzyme/uncharacterized membrane protein YdjX (TVP38/TMEM64 family)
MSSPILQPGRTVWRIERADRAAILIDGAAFFATVREAFLKAQHSIFIVGWDIDSRTELRGDGPPADGYPTGLAAFLADLVEARPGLRVHLLLWDYSLLYAHEREALPRLSLQWQMPPQVTFCLDSTVPFGSSQHQKLIVVDDAVAFSGGLDLTIRRWDTGRHALDEARRVDPTGEPYRPFHDIQMMVDGAAAHALASLARQRWCHANGGEPAIEPFGDPWPPSFPPDFTGVGIGIARTQPRYNGEEAVHEVEALFLESIRCAQRAIYIENQFATSPRIAARLARQLARCPDLEVVIVAPRSHDSFVERRTMRNGRIRFWRTVQAAGGERVRLVYPSVERDGRTTHTMIHSKIMVIDDVFLRVGSANLNNRSMGADTECDLALEAANDAERAAITRIRNRLLGEHCGVGPEAVAEQLAEHGSLVRAADTLSGGGHCLRPIDDGMPDRSLLARFAERIADPPRPLRLGRLVGRVLPRLLLKGGQALPRVSGLAIGLAAALVVALTLAWQFTGLSDLADPQEIGELLAAGAGAPWAILFVVAAFVVGGAVAFPVTVMIVATAAVFGPWLGMLYAALGVAASALALYALGAWFGQDAPAALFGARWDGVRAQLRRRGLLAMVAVRVVPVAPFTFVNLAAGASSIRLVDFALGTLIGMAPGLAALCLLGDRIVHVFSHPAAGEIAVLALCVAAWIGLSFAAQAIVSRFGGGAS